jgi:hypothetical protein
MKVCENCKKAVDILYGHHVVPKVMGGQLVVNLCGCCHSKVHNRESLMNVSFLTKIGLAVAKLNGVRLGRPLTSKRRIKRAKYLKTTGLSFADIGKIMHCTRSRVHQLFHSK